MKDAANNHNRRSRRASRRAADAEDVAWQEQMAAPDDSIVAVATIVARQPDPAYPQGLAALADVLVLQMFDSGLGETLQMAYTMIQQHQERTNRRTQLSAATEALRKHLARLDETLDDL